MLQSAAAAVTSPDAARDPSSYTDRLVPAIKCFHLANQRGSDEHS